MPKKKSKGKGKGKGKSKKQKSHAGKASQEALTDVAGHVAKKNSMNYAALSPVDLSVLWHIYITLTEDDLREALLNMALTVDNNPDARLCFLQTLERYSYRPQGGGLAESKKEEVDSRGPENLIKQLKQHMGKGGRLIDQKFDVEQLRRIFTVGQTLDQNCYRHMMFVHSERCIRYDCADLLQAAMHQSPAVRFAVQGLTEWAVSHGDNEQKILLALDGYFRSEMKITQLAKLLGAPIPFDLDYIAFARQLYQTYQYHLPYIQGHTWSHLTRTTTGTCQPGFYYQGLQQTEKMYGVDHEQSQSNVIFDVARKSALRCFMMMFRVLGDETICRENDFKWSASTGVGQGTDYHITLLMRDYHSELIYFALLNLASFYRLRKDVLLTPESNKMLYPKTLESIVQSAVSFGEDSGVSIDYAKMFRAAKDSFEAPERVYHEIFAAAMVGPEDYVWKLLPQVLEGYILLDTWDEKAIDRYTYTYADEDEDLFMLAMRMRNPVVVQILHQQQIKPVFDKAHYRRYADVCLSEDVFDVVGLVVDKYAESACLFGGIEDMYSLPRGASEYFGLTNDYKPLDDTAPILEIQVLPSQSLVANQNKPAGGAGRGAGAGAIPLQITDDQETHSASKSASI